jgi:hypothetical protein
MKFCLFLHRFQDIKFKSFRQHFVDLGHLENISWNVINFYFCWFLWLSIFFWVHIVIFLFFWKILVHIHLVRLWHIDVLRNLIRRLILLQMYTCHLIIISEISLISHLKFLSIIVTLGLNLVHLWHKLRLLHELHRLVWLNYLIILAILLKIAGVYILEIRIHHLIVAV